MKIRLENPIESRFQVVDVQVGDYVKVMEWDGIMVKGIVDSISHEKIYIRQGEFISGCYEGQYSYEQFEDMSEFQFDLEHVCEISVAQFETNFSPLVLVQNALHENYCGSEKIVMSPLFFRDYQRYMKENVSYYAQYPIEVEDNLSGYVVYATPNEESKKHKETPKLCYTIEFFQKGIWKGSRVFSCFDEERNSHIQESAEIFQRKTNIGKAAYRLRCDDEIVERGVIA